MHGENRHAGALPGLGNAMPGTCCRAGNRHARCHATEKEAIAAMGSFEVRSTLMPPRQARWGDAIRRARGAPGLRHTDKGERFCEAPRHRRRAGGQAPRALHPRGGVPGIAEPRPSCAFTNLLTHWPRQGSFKRKRPPGRPPQRFLLIRPPFAHGNAFDRRRPGNTPLYIHTAPDETTISHPDDAHG
jgi:hypothetical protein